MPGKKDAQQLQWEKENADYIKMMDSREKGKTHKVGQDNAGRNQQYGQLAQLIAQDQLKQQQQKQAIQQILAKQGLKNQVNYKG
jgi:hypothetical protein